MAVHLHRLVHAPTDVLPVSLLTIPAQATRNTDGDDLTHPLPPAPGNTTVLFPISREKGCAPAGKGGTTITAVLLVARAPQCALHVLGTALRDTTPIVGPPMKTVGPRLSITVQARTAPLHIMRVYDRCCRSRYHPHTTGTAHCLVQTAKMTLTLPNGPQSPGSLSLRLLRTPPSWGRTTNHPQKILTRGCLV